MPDKPQTEEVTPPVAEGAPVVPPVPRRGPGHRGADVRDTVAEMTEKAQQLSLEAGSKVAAAMKEVIHAAAGLTGFGLESARDLVQYMVRRGQMRPEEAEKLLREVEEAQSKRKPGSIPAPAAPLPPQAARVPEPRYVPPRPSEPMVSTAMLHSAKPAAKAAAPVRPVASAKAAAPARAAAHHARPAPSKASAKKSKPAKSASKASAKSRKPAPKKAAARKR
jgi:ribosomal protein L7/L12